MTKLTQYGPGDEATWGAPAGGLDPRCDAEPPAELITRDCNTCPFYTRLGHYCSAFDEAVKRIDWATIRRLPACERYERSHPDEFTTEEEES